MQNGAHVRFRRDLLCALCLRRGGAESRESTARQISELVDTADYALRTARKSLVRSGNTKIHGLGERRLHRRVGEQRERVAGNSALMVGASDGILERAMLTHQADSVFEVCVGRLAPFQRAAPKLTFAIGAAAKGEHDRQRDLALAEVVADFLAEFSRCAAIVEDVIDQLESNAEIHAERAAGSLLIALSGG